jgi:NAD(P)-dependent dehydrogenase (short-subunit alcohol dehydrogenase family)
VVVVAGETDEVVPIAAALVDRGALVAVVHPTLGCERAAASFRADPTDPAVWERVAPHVEQRLGPVDLVVVDLATRPAAETALGDALRRRHRPTPVVLGPAEPAAAVVSRLTGTPPATPPPPPDVDPG